MDRITTHHVLMKKSCRLLSVLLGKRNTKRNTNKISRFATTGNKKIINNKTHEYLDVDIARDTTGRHTPGLTGVITGINGLLIINRYHGVS